LKLSCKCVTNSSTVSIGQPLVTLSSLVSLPSDHKKLRYHTVTARRTRSAQILSTAAQLYQNSHLKKNL